MLRGVMRPNAPAASTRNSASLPHKTRNLRMSLILTASLVALATSPLRAQVSYNWTNPPIGAGGFVTGMVIHPTSTSNKYVRTDVGGAYRWETSSKWTPITDALIQKNPGAQSIESIAIDPSNASRVYIAAGNTVFVSNDKGNNWSSTGLNTKTDGNADWRSAGERLVVDPNNGGKTVFFGSRWDGLWKRFNGGSWSKVTTLPAGTAAQGVSFVVFDKRSGNSTTNTSTLYVGVMGNGVYKSTDGGSNWNLLNGGPATSRLPMRAVIDPNGVLYVTYTSGNWWSPGGGAIYKFATNGTATNITPDANKSYCAIALHPTNASTLMAAEWRFSSNCQFYRTTNGGAQWNTVTTNVTKGEPWWPGYTWATGPSGLIYDPANPIHTWSTDGIAVWRTDDNSSNTQNWKGVHKGIEEFVTQSVVKIPGGPLLNGVNDMVGFTHNSLTTAPTVKWDGEAFGDATGIDFCETQPHVVARVSGDGNGQGFGHISNDKGNTWTAFGNVPSDAKWGKIAVSATNPDKMVWVSTGWNTPYVTENRGASWVRVQGFPQNRNLINDKFTNNQPLAADRVNGNTFYLYGGESDFYRSADGGKNWTKVNSGALPWWWQHKLLAMPGSEGELWMSFTGAGAGSGLYRSTDGGANWTKISNIQNVSSFAFGKAAPSKSKPTVFVYGVINNGQRAIFRSDDISSTQGSGSTATWTKIQSDSQGIPAPSGNAMDGDREVYGKVYIGTGGRSLFVGEPAHSTTGPNLVSNASFDAENYDTQTPSGWGEWSDNGALDASYTESYGGSKSGARHGTHWKTSAYRIYTYQVKTSLANGLYTLRCWARSSGGQSQCYLEAKDFGGTNRTANLPVSNTYQLVEIKDINVTNGQCTIGIWSNSGAHNWAYFDDFEFFKQ